MDFRNKLIKIFNLEKGEEKIVLLIIVYSFFMGATIAFFVSSATGLFLSSFEREKLPMAFIASGVIVYLIGIVFSKLQKNIKFSKLIKLALGFLFISSGIFLAFYLLDKKSLWIVFVLYAWIRVFAYIHAVVFWGTATKLFDLRQGKRIFGLIGTGEVLSSIISFFSIPILLNVIETKDLLIIASVCLIFSFVIMLFIIKSEKDKLSDIKKVKPVAENLKNEKSGISFFQNKYFTIIFFITLFPVISQFLVDFIFQAQAKVQFPIRDSLTGFIGIFFGITSIIEFVLKTFLSGRLISRYGIKLGLVVFPLVLIFSFLFASLTGTFDVTISLFFPFVALGRLFTRAARTSFNDPSTQILFQPIPKEIRLAFQSKIEGGPKAFGNIIAGILILILSTLSFLELVHFSYILLVIVFIWLKFAFDAYKEYKKTIENVLKTDKIISETEKTIHNENLEIIQKYLNKSDTAQFRRNIKISKNIEPHLTDEILIQLFNKSSDEKKQIIVNQFVENYNYKKLKTLSENIDESNINSPTNILEFINNKYNEFTNIDYQEIIKYSDSENIDDRLKAAYLLGFSNRYNAYLFINKLLNDKIYKVKVAAIIAAGENQNPELWNKLFDFLKNDTYRNFAYSSIINHGDKILKELEKFYNKNTDNQYLKSIILRIFSLIVSKKSLSFLRNQLKNISIHSRDEMINSLLRINYVSMRLETPYLNNHIEEIIKEIVWISAAIEDIKYENPSELIEALNNEIEVKKENLFDILSVVYGKNNIEAVKNNLADSNGENKGYALEILDMIFPEQTKNLLLPLFESDFSFEIFNSYKIFFPQVKMIYNHRLIDIIEKDYTKINLWIKTLALLELSKLRSFESERILITNIPNPNNSIKEIALSKLYKFDKDKLVDQLIKLKPKDKVDFQALIKKIKKQSQANNLFIFEKIQILKKIDLFSDISDSLIIKIAEKSKDIKIQKEKTQKINTSKNLIYIIEGKILIPFDNKKIEAQTEILLDFTYENISLEIEIQALETTSLLIIDKNIMISMLNGNQVLLSNYFEFHKSSIL